MDICKECMRGKQETDCRTRNLNSNANNMPFMLDKSNTSRHIDNYVSWPEGDAMVTSKNARMLITRDGGGDRALMCFVCYSKNAH